MNTTVTLEEKTPDRVAAADLAVMRRGSQPEASDEDNLVVGQQDVLAAVRRVGSAPAPAPAPALQFHADQIGTFPVFVRIEYHDLARCTANGKPGSALAGGETTAAFLRVAA